MIISQKSQSLLTEPFWRAEDLGRALPDTPHAASVCLPLWEHVVGYEERDPEVIDKLACGYPRFVVHPHVQRLNHRLLEQHGHDGEALLPLPSEKVARHFLAFLREHADATGRLVFDSVAGIFPVFYPETAAAIAKRFWQHFGQGISSRRAEAILEGRAQQPLDDLAKSAIRRRIADCTGANADDVYLYSSGMAALSEALFLAQALRPGLKSVQLGFPYVDILKIQTVDGPGVHFMPRNDVHALEALANLLREEPISAVVTEFPGNPLLQGADLARLRELLNGYDVPLIVDDTPATFYNADVLRFADVVATSLTKTFSGAGDVMAGSVVLSRFSRFYSDLRERQERCFEDLFWHEDARVLECNSINFCKRVPLLNETTEALCDYLRSRPEVARVYYPKFEMKDAFDAVRKPQGGYSGLFSLDLVDASRRAPRFYDRLRVSKGPSLGNNFTLACPYTLLAHYDELDWAEAAGISRYLVRVSVGLEPAEDLINRFEEALQ